MLENFYIKQCQTYLTASVLGITISFTAPHHTIYPVPEKIDCIRRPRNKFMLFTLFFSSEILCCLLSLTCCVWCMPNINNTRICVYLNAVSAECLPYIFDNLRRFHTVWLLSLSRIR